MADEFSYRSLIGGNTRVNGSRPQMAITEPRYVIRGADVVAQGNVLTSISTSYAIPLHVLGNHSLLDIDKDLYFGEILYLTFVFAPYSIWVFEADLAAPPGNINPLGTVPVVSNRQLLLSLEICCRKRC